jgi:hypothetical protein
MAVQRMVNVTLACERLGHALRQIFRLVETYVAFNLDEIASLVRWASSPPAHIEHRVERLGRQWSSEVTNNSTCCCARLDERASKQGHHVIAALAQYSPAQGDTWANFERIQKLLDTSLREWRVKGGRSFILPCSIRWAVRTGG